ncbi:hypothetical protein ACOSQ4_000630 [Xanthoceras sorbifolium]
MDIITLPIGSIYLKKYQPKFISSQATARQTSKREEKKEKKKTMIPSNHKLTFLALSTTTTTIETTVLTAATTTTPLTTSSIARIKINMADWFSNIIYKTQKTWHFCTQMGEKISNYNLH